jgi:hypothetical protein
LNPYLPICPSLWFLFGFIHNLHPINSLSNSNFILVQWLKLLSISKLVCFLSLCDHFTPNLYIQNF